MIAVFSLNCLLFGQDRQTSWTKTGFVHLENLSKSMQGHEITVEHIRRSLMLLATYGKSLWWSADNRDSIHNEKADISTTF